MCPQYLPQGLFHHSFIGRLEAIGHEDVGHWESSVLAMWVWLIDSQLFIRAAKKFVVQWILSCLSHGRTCIGETLSSAIRFHLWLASPWLPSFYPLQIQGWRRKWWQALSPTSMPVCMRFVSLYTRAPAPAPMSGSLCGCHYSKPFYRLWNVVHPQRLASTSS